MIGIGDTAMKLKNIILLILFLSVGCTSTAANTGISVYASFWAMYDFTKTIGGDRVNISLLVPPGTEPHDWEPSPAVIAGLTGAKALIYNGAGLEGFIDDFKSALTDSNLLFVEASSGIPLLSDEEGSDPHVWLNPMYAKQEMQNIKNLLCQLSPEDASYFEANYNEAARELDVLDADYRKAVSGFASMDIVITHGAFAYLCDAYGLRQVSILNLNPDNEPTPARMSEIISYIKENHISTIFTEETFSRKTADIIAEETGAQTIVLSSFESSDKGYFEVMRDNLAKLEAALK